MYDEKLWQFDNIVEGQIDNEVAKAIEKAHNYHFNLQNYRSNLSVEQIKDWQEVLKGTEIKNGSKIDKRYQELQKADPKIALQILASFDAQNALQMDIARGYLSKLDKQILEKDEKLVKLFEILKETKQFPFETLGELLIQKANKIKLEDDVLYRQVTIKLYGKGVFVRQEVLGSEIKTESQFIVNEGDFIMSKIDARNGAFGIVPAILDGAVVTSSFPYFEIKTDKVNPKYLEAIVTQKSFYDQINNMVSGATGRRSVEVDNFLELQIPLPPLEVQNEIVAKIEKQKQIIEGAERIEKNFLIPENIFEDSSWDTVLLSDICKFSGGSQPPKESFIYEEQDGYIRLIQIRDFKSDDFKTFVKKDSVTKFFNKDDVMIARYGPPIFQILRGMEGAYNVALMKAIPDETRIDKNYLFYYLQNPKIQNFVVNNSQRSAGQSGVNTDLLNSYQVFLPPLETQRQIVEKLDKQMQALEGVRLLKTEAEKRIDEILAGVWGE